MRTPYFLLFFSIIIFGGLSAHAQILNGSFSTGDFTDWHLLGVPTIDTSNVPSDASYAALIESTNSVATSPFGDPGPVNSSSADTITDINSVLGTSIVGGGTANSGEAIYQSFTLSAATTLTFETSFASYDSKPQDSAGYVLNGVYHQLYTTPQLADTTPTAFAPTTINVGAGPNTLAFVVYNTTDDTFDSELWVTDVALAPEPSTWLLIVMGVVGVFTAGLAQRTPRPAAVVKTDRLS